jgi:hypothetical protein
MKGERKSQELLCIFGGYLELREANLFQRGRGDEYYNIFVILDWPR